MSPGGGGGGALEEVLWKDPLGCVPWRVPLWGSPGPFPTGTGLLDGVLDVLSCKGPLEGASLCVSPMVVLLGVPCGGAHWNFCGGCCRGWWRRRFCHGRRGLYGQRHLHTYILFMGMARGVY